METVSEIWRAIPDVDNYEASNHGRIRSLPHESVFVTGFGECRRMFPGRMVNPFLKRGYYHVSISRGNGRRQRPVHQLVAAAFLGRRGDGMATNHINGVKTDNRPENLEYITNSENVHHAYRTGLLNNSGANSSLSKLKDEDVREIRRLKGTETVEALAMRFGITPSYARRLVNGQGWKHIA
jgi:hypothetical protein